MMSPQDVTAPRGPDPVATTGSWDPYDIWLTRVKQPRDRLPPRVVAAVDIPAAVTETQTTEPLLLRAT